MKSICRKGIPIVALLLMAGTAQALPLLDVTSSLSLSDPTQRGRLARTADPQDWSGSELFFGVLDPTTTFHYHTFLVNVGLTPFIQISVDSMSTNTFFSTYDTAYLPNSSATGFRGFDTNWLGDVGRSGNPFPGDPAFFQVLVPINHLLLVIVNNTADANGGVGDPFHLLVEGFIDSEFTDPPSVPEPATVLLSCTGLAMLVVKREAVRYKLSRSAQIDA